jgi:uncharacterized protein YndB with AHSA1/START domain
MTTTTEKPNLREFIISRTFNAPRELMWKALTEPERIQQWFSPKGFARKALKMEFRPGGTYHFCMSSPDGKEMWGKVVYREISEPGHIVLINSFSDAQCGLTRHPMNATWPLEMHTTYTLAEHEGKTTFTIKWTPENATAEEIQTFEAAHASMTQGWTGTLDNLTEYLAKAQ